MLFRSFDLSRRDNLAETLGIARPADHSDADLVEAAYRKWGVNCPPHLNGHFSFCIWDARESRLFACRDHLGTIPLFYWNHGSQFFCTSHPRSILESLPFERQLNHETLAACLIVRGYHLRPGDTFHQNVFSLPPASFLIANARGVSVSRYWRPEIRPEIVPMIDHEVFAKARALVEASVADRLASRTSVAIKLSGGLDSSAIAAVAANYLRKRNRSLLAITAVNQDSEVSIADERDYVDQLRIFPNIQFHRASANGKGPFDRIGDTHFFEPFFLVNPTQYLNEAMRGYCLGADGVLSGGFGEFCISGTSNPHVESLARFQWNELASDVRQSSQTRGVSGVRILAGSVRRHLFPQTPAAPSLYLSDGLLRQHNPARYASSSLWPNGQRDHLRTIENYLDRDVLRSTFPAEVDPGPMVYPFLDKDLFEYCLAVPPRFKHRYSYGRYLLRKAFEDVLPPQITWRRGKTPYSPDYSVRYNAQIEVARDFVRGIPASDPVRSIVDVNRLERAIVPVQRGVNEQPAWTAIPRSIYLIHFLRQFSGFR